MQRRLKTAGVTIFDVWCSDLYFEAFLSLRPAVSYTPAAEYAGDFGGLSQILPTQMGLLPGLHSREPRHRVKLSQKSVEV